MKSRLVLLTFMLAFATFSAMTSAPAQNFSPEDLARRTIERRAVEAMNWGMSAVNTDMMLQEMQLGGCDGKIANCLPVVPGWNYTVRLYRRAPRS